MRGAKANVRFVPLPDIIRRVPQPLLITTPEPVLDGRILHCRSNGR